MSDMTREEIEKHRQRFGVYHRDMWWNDALIVLDQLFREQPPPIEIRLRPLQFVWHLCQECKGAGDKDGKRCRNCWGNGGEYEIEKRDPENDAEPASQPPPSQSAREIAEKWGRGPQNWHDAEGNPMPSDVRYESVLRDVQSAIAAATRPDPAKLAAYIGEHDTDATHDELARIIAAYLKENP